MCYMSHIKSDQPVGVRELRQNLSVYLERLKAGTVFRVTDRGRAVALLIPIPQHSTAVERMIASGRATAPKQDLLAITPLKTRGGRKVSDAVLADRSDRL